MAEAIAVELAGLEKRFGAVQAVSGLSLAIRSGETFGLLGPNGAGKTTTLSILSTLLPPTRGEARIFGKSLAAHAAEIRSLTGLAPQEIALYPDLSGEENLAFFGRLYGLRGPRLRERVASLLEQVGLAPRRADRVHTYSGGMRRRLNLACSLVHEPKLLLLDEPTLGVDPQSRGNLLDTIQALAGHGTTVIYTTHYMEEAERLCDRIAIMDAGRIIALGTLAELVRMDGVAAAPERPGRSRGMDLEQVFMHLTGRGLRD